MLVYLNRGLILEQAICTLIDEYIGTIKLNETFANFHTHVTLQHPFAHLFMETGLKAADHFPVIVVSTYEDDKPPEMDGLPPYMQGTELDAVGITESDIDTIMNINGKDGKPIPGIPLPANPESISILKNILETKEHVFGYSVRTYRKDSISIEIWAENAQIKNQIYEDLRLFVLGNLRHILTDKYEGYDLKIDSESINGQRSSAYNIDFGVVLFGANIRFEANYAVEQVLINTELEGLQREIILEDRKYAQV